MVAAALVGLIVWSVTAEQIADFGLLRALGVRPIQLGRIVIAQAALIAGVGYLLAAAAAYGAQVLVGDRMGEVTIAITPACWP